MKRSPFQRLEPVRAIQILILTNLILLITSCGPAPEEQALADVQGIWLISEAELNQFQASAPLWSKYEDDYIDPEHGTVCRGFKQVSSDDLLVTNLVALTNCVVYLGPDYTMDDLVASLFAIPHTELQTSMNYPGEFALYGMVDGNTGHRIYKGLLLSDVYLHRIMLEVRTPLGWSLESNEHDELIHFVLTQAYEKQMESPLH